MEEQNFEIYCENCEEPILLPLDFLEQNTEVECQKCKHTTKWQVCKFCGTGHYMSDFFKDGVCNDCFSIPAPKPKEELGFIRRFLSSNCPYCSYPVFSINMFFGSSGVQCPMCKHISEVEGVAKAYIGLFIFFMLFAYIGDKLEITSYFPDRSIGAIALMPFVIVGGVIVMTKAYSLKKSD